MFQPDQPRFQLFEDCVPPPTPSCPCLIIMYYILNTHYSAKVFNCAQPPFNSFMVPSLAIPPLFGIRYIIHSPVPLAPPPYPHMYFSSCRFLCTVARKMPQNCPVMETSLKYPLKTLATSLNHHCLIVLIPSVSNSFCKTFRFRNFLSMN